jgi:hypothetical protein
MDRGGAVPQRIEMRDAAEERSSATHREHLTTVHTGLNLTADAFYLAMATTFLQPFGPYVSPHRSYGSSGRHRPRW